MISVWVLAAAVVLFDLLVARQIVVEYRRYRYRQIMQKMTIDLNTFAATIGEVFVPVIRQMTVAFSAFATAVGELYEDER